MAWVDREGRTEGLVGSPNTFDGLSLSPDGRKVAVPMATLADAGLGNIDVWVVDLARGVSERLTTDVASDRGPVWSPAGDRLAFFSVRTKVGDLYATSSSGTGEALLLKSELQKIPTSWSSDGRFLLYSATDPKTASDIWLLPLRGDRKPVPLVQTEFAESEARFSPDMRWIAYTSLRSGRPEIHVRAFDATSPGSSSGEATPVSKDGGRQARWRQDGRELIFQAADNSIMAVNLTIDKQLHVGTPTRLFVPAGLYWDVTADGRRFLVTMPPADAGLTPITVMMNWK
jgi:Tol biopolymer transport system component